MKTKRRKILLYGLAFLLVYSWIKNRAPNDLFLQASSNKETLTFIVMGDWGTKGKFHQKSVARQINATSAAEKVEFIITTGDNFYPVGVRNVEDLHWTQSYKDIYIGSSTELPWYPVLGNHDYGGSIEAQFEYSQHSKSWTFPGKHYALEQQYGDDETALFIFLDTNPFYDSYYTEKRYENIESADSLLQIEWFEKLLDNSKADWKIVIGHHPLYTGGLHANDPQYVRRHLEKLFKKHEIDAYFAGHDHDLQHLSPPGITEYFVSGAAARVRPTGKTKHSKASISKPGFILAELKEKHMQVSIIGDSGDVLHQSSVEKKEKKNSFFW